MDARRAPATGRPWRLQGTGELGHGAGEVKEHEHAKVVREVADQFVRWYLVGTFRPRIEEADWCHLFFGCTTKLRTCTPIGSLTTVTWCLERNLRLMN